MIKVGITGGIGTGKSTVSKMFMQENFKLVDADIIAREVLDKNPSLYDTIRIQFGAGFFDWRGQFRRKEFGNHIFRFPKQRKRYEDLIMPYIKEEIKRQFDEYEAQGENIVFLDAPTLIENNFQTQIDYLIVVYVDSATQIKRVMERDNLSKSDVTGRINAQISLETKKQMADIVIDTGISLEETQKQVNDIIEFIRKIV